jgi:peptidyl-prolyl cis-trans isomerase A (cyclophilin A)
VTNVSVDALHDVRANAGPAPEAFSVRLETTRGEIIVDVERALAPKGADRFHQLVLAGYYDDVAFFRVVSGFVVQWGIHGVPAVNKIWRDARIADDPVRTSNAKGTITFATSGPNARTAQVFVNLRDNARLDAMGFAPFGRVADVRVVEALHAGYGEGPPGGSGPQQSRIQREGNAFLRAEFPLLDFVRRASIVAR